MTDRLIPLMGIGLASFPIEVEQHMEFKMKVFTAVEITHLIFDFTCQ